MDKVNNLNEMPPKCQKCHYWGFAEPPYSCYACEEKYRKSEEEREKEKEQLI